MDAWCALWMWAPANGTHSADTWMNGSTLPNCCLGSRTAWTPAQLFTPYELDDGSLESVELVRQGKDRRGHQSSIHGLFECRSISAAQNFFHWELEFAPLFSAGGFHLQIGNPPWVRLRWSGDVALAEHDPFFAVTSSIPPGGPRTATVYCAR